MIDINIKIEDKMDKKGWSDFLRHTDSYRLVTCIEYYDLLKADYFIITAYDRDNVIVGGTICRIRGGVFPFSIFSKALWIESGLLVKKANSIQEKELKDELLKFIEIEARKRKCCLIEFNHWCMQESQEMFLSNCFNIIYYSTFISDLTLSQEELYSRFDRNTKSAIKKAQKSKLNFYLAKNDELSIVQDFYKIYKLTQKRAASHSKNISMTLKPQDFIRGILEKDTLNCYLSYTKFEDKLAAGIILVISGSTLICYSAASDIEINREYGASSFLFWESMLWAKNRGMKYFDFGGVPTNASSDNPAYGVYRFKKNFGGKLTQFPTGQKILSPLKANVLNTILGFRSIIRILMKFSRKF